jgi:dihydroorotase
MGLDEVQDLIVCHGKIVAMGKDLELKTPAEGKSGGAPAQTVDLSGKVLMPGLLDMHVHLREPGFEYKGDIESETAAALAGGFTGVLAMPNTNPVCDTGEAVRFVRDKAAQVGYVQVYVAGALTHGLEGKAISEMGDMVANGAVAFTDDGHGVQAAGQMRRSMDYARQFDLPCLSHCQDESLSGPGVVNEGAVSTRLGLLGWPAAAEEIQIERDIALCRLTGTSLHLQHVSTARGLELVKAAKAEGLPVTCEVTPHHLFLCEDDIDSTYNTNLKVNPPLRTAADAAALRDALAVGDVDVVATDHAPHALHEKQREFELAPFGTTGAETALALMYTELIAPGKLSWNQLVQLMSVAPRRILRLAPVELKEGTVADFTVFDPSIAWTVEASGFKSKAQNSAFLGRALQGKATDVCVDGHWRLQAGQIVE